MNQAGARHCADVNGTFCTDPGADYGSGSKTASEESANDTDQSAPRVPMIQCLDADSLCEVAEFMGISVKELEFRYSQ
jgi:hypothetical protein